MKQKGFTLVELLAVIVVLAIIALIAVPILLNVVNKARKGAAINSAYGYLESLQNYTAISDIDTSKIRLESNKKYFVVEKSSYDETTEETTEVEVYLNNVIKHKGDKPIDGYVVLDEKKVMKESRFVFDRYEIECDNKECKIGDTLTGPVVKELALSLSEMLVGVGKTRNLDATTDPEKAKITWTSSDPTVATVDETGKITGIKDGETIITAKAYIKRVTCKVTVKDTYDVGETLTKDSLYDVVTDPKLTETGVYPLVINGVNMSAHIYVIDGNQEWKENKTFGDAADVATASTYAQNMVIVKVNGNVTIDSGVTVTAFGNIYGGPKGLTLYVTGKLTNNGTITMTARGAKAESQDVYLYKNNDNTYEYVPAIGGAGGTAGQSTCGSCDIPGATGETGLLRSTGGGGAGGAAYYNKSGSGSTGTSYSGGTGGGGAVHNTGANGFANGGAGGNAGSSGSHATGGGTGNPGGLGTGTGGVSGGNGTGGLLVIYANQYVNKGTISATGINGSSGSTSGGASGGGSINIFTNQSTGINQLGIITDTRYNEIKGSTNASGGSGVGGASKGGNGGTGTTNIGKIIDGEYYDLKTAIDNDREAYISSITKEGDSILQILEKNDLKTGYYYFVVNGQKYPIHLYTLVGNQEWKENKVFGDATDVATASTYAQNMVIVKVNGNVTIKEGVTVRPYYDAKYGGPKGLTLYVTGKLTNNGVIDNSHGAKAEGQDVYLYKNNDGTYETVPAAGGIGGVSVASTCGSCDRAGTTGGSGLLRSTGGGGAGGASYYSASGSGSSGTSYSGGTGGGGSLYNNATNGIANGGIGGNAGVSGDWPTGGGTGNPGGVGGHGGPSGENGTGGLLVIYANNYLNNGTISAAGTNGSNISNSPTGGASGGGSVNIFSLNNFKNGTINVNGGLGLGGVTKGGAGGKGTITTGSISTGKFVAQ